jgi:hypothetical protein
LDRDDWKGRLMKTARITSPNATEALFPLVDDLISTVAQEEEMAAEVAEIDAAVEEAEREWAAAARAEVFRVSRDLTDQVRARRAHRRVGRVVLRSLPRQFGAPGEYEGEAA